MQNYDTYMKADSFDALASFCSAFRNVIGPTQGFPGVPETTNEDGTANPAIPAKGDPSKFYVCVRAPFIITSLPDGVEAITKEEGSQVVGVWA